MRDLTAMGAGMADEFQRIRRVSAVSIALAVLAAAFILTGLPTFGLVSGRIAAGLGLATGICAGLISIACSIHLRRRNHTLPKITLAALVLGSVSLTVCALLIGYTFYVSVTCYNAFAGC